MQILKTLEHVLALGLILAKIMATRVSVKAAAGPRRSPPGGEIIEEDDDRDK